MGEIIYLKNFREKNKYYKALCDQKQISYKHIEVQQIFEFLEEARMQANYNYDPTLIAVVLEQIIANQLKDIKNQNKKINQVNYLLNIGQRICQNLEMKTKIEAQLLLFFLINNFIDKIKIIKTDNNKGFYVSLIEGRIYISSEGCFWNGEELIEGSPSFDNSFNIDYALVEIKKFLDYLLKNLPELHPIIKNSPFWIE